jgi:hypothetical protein
VADYGVNIKVGVQGQNNAKQLGEQIREIVRGLEAADSAFTRFTNNLKSFDQRRAQRKINEELDNTAQKYRELDRLQRQLLANDNSAIKTAEKRAKIEDHISKNISAGRIRRRARFLRGDPEQFPSGANQPFAPDPMVAIKKQRDAEAKFAREIFNIEQDFNRRINNTEIDLLQDKIKREIDAQQEIFNNAMRLNRKAENDFDKRLAQRTRAKDEATRFTGQTSPIGGAVGIPGSPAALRAAERAQRLRSASSSALIGGAFPLLFGQGLGAAGGGLVGGFGGGMVGGEFGFGLSLIGTQVGSIFDQLASKAVDLGAALNPLTADIEAVVTAAGESDTEFQKLLAAYEDQAGAQEALEFATNRLATVVGIEGVNSLNDFNSDMVRAGSEFNKFTSIVLAGIANLINQTGIFQKFTELGERSRLLISARRSNDPEIQRLLRQRAQAKSKENPFLAEFSPILAAQQIQNTKSIEDEIVSLQRVNEEKELGLQQSDLEAKVSEKRLQTLKGSRQELEAQNTILKNNGNLLKQEVFDAEKLLINEKMRAEVDKIRKNQKEAEVKSSPAVIQEQINQAVLKKDNELLQLTNRRASAQEAADKKAAAANKKRQDELDRLEAKKQKAIEQAIKNVDRELERTDKAFDKASSQLDKITQKHEDKMAFEREYSRLIKEGSTPAAAKQAIELQKQLLELDRSFEKQEQLLKQQVQSVKLSIEKARAEGATTDELQKQLDRLKDIEAEINKLPSKKGKAKGAIEEALAVETGRDKIETEMDRIQGVLNDLVDPANQVIAAANAIGDAFSESFKGLITGSMSAQEALRNLFARTADHFADMAAQMIANAIKMKILGIALNAFGSAAGSFSQAPSAAAQTAGANAFSQPAVPFTLGFAEGGYVSSPTRALIGEGGEPEFVIPESKMRESMARYSRGARGSAVIPEAGGSGTSGEGGGVAVAAPIDVRYTVERINSVDYVTADQFQQGMQQAATQGAKQGEQQTLKRLQMSGSTRRRLGM